MKKIVVACIVTLLAAGSSLAARNNVELYVPESKCEQEHTDPPVKNEDAPAVETVSSTEIVSRAEVAPSFPGGDSQLYSWLAKNIVYPPMAAEKKVKGRVVVQFVVLSDGSIGETKVIKSVDADLDKEAVRVVKAMPKWNPGTVGGKPVNVWYTLPITFNIH
ncbi:MAG: energy transducer TonB [Duncaniella sp.]|nr:energy transducer TonB [Duncaniella sp.]